MATLRLAMIFVKDLERMQAFYREALQLHELPEAAQDGWVEFEDGGVRLALHQIQPQYAEGIVIESPPRARESAPTKLVFEVDDMDAAIARLTEHGASMREPWAFGGCDGLDPEGNVFQIVKRGHSFGPPVPELPVADVVRAQEHYRNVLGFEVGWLDPSGDIGAVSRGDTAIFFRKRTQPFEPSVHWLFAPDIETTHDELSAAGARIVEPLEQKPWGLRQLTVEDLDGNRFYFHCD